MVRFGEILTKDVRVPYTKDDIEGVVATGVVAYNKEKKVTNMTGDIRDLKDNLIARFELAGQVDNLKVRMYECDPKKMVEAMEIAQATIADLAASYPQE